MRERENWEVVWSGLPSVGGGPFVHVYVAFHRHKEYPSRSSILDERETWGVNYHRSSNLVE